MSQYTSKVSVNSRVEILTTYCNNTLPHYRICGP